MIEYLVVRRSDAHFIGAAEELLATAHNHDQQGPADSMVRLAGNHSGSLSSLIPYGCG
jgi:hypothetical protein